MANYTALPVYRASYRLSLAIFRLTKNFSREFRYCLGERIKGEGLDLILSVYQANRCDSSEKLDYILKAKEKLEVIKLLLRLSYDLKLIKLDLFIKLSEDILEISNHLGAWLKYHQAVKSA